MDVCKHNTKLPITECPLTFKRAELRPRGAGMEPAARHNQRAEPSCGALQAIGTVITL